MASKPKLVKTEKPQVEEWSLPLGSLVYAVQSIPPGLLMNAPNAMRRAGEPDPQGGKVPSAEQEAEDGAYRLPDNALYFPGSGFRKSLINAAMEFSYKKGGRGRAVRLSGTLGGILFIAEDKVPLIDPETGAPITEYEIDQRRVVINGSSAVVRARPLVREWASSVKFDYLAEYIDADEAELNVTNAFRCAGMTVGVGNYRPDKRLKGTGGPYGRFTVELLEHVRFKSA
jgi:hypothetical protein